MDITTAEVQKEMKKKLSALCKCIFSLRICYSESIKIIQHFQAHNTWW